MKVLIQWLSLDGTWQDYDTCDAETAGRLIGYGNNHLFYRALNPETREVIMPEESTAKILRLDLANWSREDVAILDILIQRNS